MIKRLLLIALFLSVAASAQAVTRYMVPIAGFTNCSQGSTNYIPDLNVCNGVPGSGATVYIASSQSNLNTALAATNAGDSLLFRAGTYNLKIDGNSAALKAGTSFSNAVTFAAYPGNCTSGCETVTFTSNDGQSIINVATSALSPTLRYVIFDGLQINGADARNGQSNVGFGGSPDHIRFINVRSYNNSANWTSLNRGAGFIVFGNDHEFINVESDYNGAGATSLGGNNAPYGFYVSQGARVLIENSSIHHNGAYGIHGFSSVGGITDHIYRNNDVYDNGRGFAGAGILISGGSGNRAYNNRVYRNYSGLYVNYNCTDCTFYSNTSYDNQHYGLEIGSSTGTGLTVKNNILYSNPDASIINNGSAVPLYERNLCTSGCTGTGTLNGVNPLFVDGANGDFNLQATSPAINAGTANITPGITIPACSPSIVTNCYNAAAPDIGAMEAGVPTGNGPPTLTPNLTTVAASAPILLTVDDDDFNERIESTGDWVAMFVPGASASLPAIDWFYMNGTKTAPGAAISDAVISFIAPAIAGAYEFRFYANNSTAEIDRLATAAFTVTGAGIVMKFNISTLKIGPSVTWKIGTP